MHPTDIIRSAVDDREYEEEEVPPEELPDENVRTFQQEVPGEDVTDRMLREDIANPNGWLHHNKGHEQIGFAPASRITPDNVGDLSPEYNIDDYTGNQTEPLVVPGDPPVLYYTQANPQEVRAVNARTGEEYWRFAYANDDTKGLAHANRGVSVYQDKVFLGTHDNSLVAIDRYTGEEVWTTKTLTPKQKEEMSVPERMASTQAPEVYDGLVFKGMTGYYGGWGAYSALDAETGEIEWQYEVIPEDEWVGESWRYGDAAPWNISAIDPESGTIFIPGANPGPMMNGVVRPGPNKHSDSVIALDAATGEEKWTTQLVAHDWHDYDTYNTRVVEMEVDGEIQRVVEAVNKTGYLYFLDIETGQLIERSRPYAKQGGEVDFMGILPKGQENAATVWPSDWGSTEWTPDSYNPQTGLAHIAANDTVKRYWYGDYEYDESVAEVNTGGGLELVDYEEFPDISAHLVAIDPASGEEVWREELEQDELQSRAGGTTATGGGVVFGSSPTANLVAVDAESGERLWEHSVADPPRGITAAPVSWDDPVEGKQYVAIASTDGIQVFALAAEQTTETPAETEAPTETELPTAEPTEADTDTSTEAGTDQPSDADSETTNTSGPGFGAAAAATALGSAAFAAKRRLDEEED
ncbi:methanol/ethanol family PQQ-dependent dehydrogenase [Halolamina litorea]|uniref:PQQ-binding-like beta-propeller repeat protein n=1 Tax=Halolamina litorea TaxID=1515593 RepID=A0ABD6BT27_9EURY|nr:PQQ-binding-like beta-propeller repeat protein [Halolamina litorea]